MSYRTSWLLTRFVPTENHGHLVEKGKFKARPLRPGKGRVQDENQKLLSYFEVGYKF